MSDDPRFLSHDACVSLATQLLSYTKNNGATSLTIASSWRSDVRWARNRIAVAGDHRDSAITIHRQLFGGRSGTATTNQLDSLSLQSAMRWAEQMLHVYGQSDRQTDASFTPVSQPYPTTHVWSDATYAQPSEARSTIANAIVEGAEQANVLSAGYLSVGATGQSVRTSDGVFLYAPLTTAECSLTVRDPQHSGSGWAGASSYEWARLNPQALAHIALDKCLRSRNPVAIEPGRYTLIMEPQATFDLMSLLVRQFGGNPPLDRRENESPRQTPFPFYLPMDQVQDQDGHGMTQYLRTKIGQPVLDERITIGYEPTDPDLGVIPFTSGGEAYVPVTWIDHGVLTTLAYDRDYAQHVLHQPWGVPNSGAYRMSGGTTSIEEMISTSERALLVTRFSGIDAIDLTTLVATGMTRDGVWLIERGTISKPVMNMRWTESPLFAFNSVEQLGVPVPVFSPGLPAVVPPVKVRDFPFTSLVGAI